MQQLSGEQEKKLSEAVNKGQQQNEKFISEQEVMSYVMWVVCAINSVC